MTADVTKRRDRSSNNTKERRTIAYTKDGKVSDVTRFLLTENPYILSGFREYTECSFLECSKSTFHIHNDTMNIWTHLLAGLWAVSNKRKKRIIEEREGRRGGEDKQISEGYHVLTSPFYYHARGLDKFMFFSFLFCTMLCFFASTAYHIYRSHSVKMFHFNYITSVTLAFPILLSQLISCFDSRNIFLVFDVGSIALQIFGSVTLMAYFDLQCHPRFRAAWLSAVTIWFVVSIVAVPFLLRRKMTSMRTFLLSTFALSGLAANIISASFRNFTFSDHEVSVLIHVMICYIMSGVGLVIRRVRVPEMFSPGNFDIWLGSHQIFHLFVACGPLSILKGYSSFLLLPPCIV